tara:strand:- start:12745 stop:13185 length:441 start_codon:yes stop_codon:yes gene_type:complete
MCGEPAADESQPMEVARKQVRPDAASQAGAWIDAKLARLREPDPASETEPATMAEFLEKNRKEMAKWPQERNDDLDRYIAQADRMGGTVDPAAVRAALRKERPDQDIQVLFLHWLDKDPEGALAGLARNRHLHELGYLLALLERMR